METKYCKICGKALTNAAVEGISFCSDCISRANVRITPNNSKGEMFMKDYIKLGFGVYIGWTLAKVARKVIGKALGLNPEKSKNETVESEKD